LKAVRTGVDMEMVSTSYWENLKALIDSGKVPMKEIDDSVRNILRVKFRLGLFDKPIPAAAPKTPPPSDEALAIAKRLAIESLVLLKNDGVLPLKSADGKVAVIGPLADSPVDQMGSWVMDGRQEEVRTPLAALRETLGADRVLYVRALKTSRDLSRDGFPAALKAASAADAVLLFLGEEQILSGEAHSRAYLNLPGAQEALVEEMAKSGKPLVAVILAGRPLTFASAAARVRAVLYAWHPGTMGGPAIADVLLGKAVPSGRLSATFPRTVGQVPIYYAHLNTGRPPSASDLGIPAGTPIDPKGFNSKYLAADFTPEFPFGFGLSYTTFEYSNLRIATPKIPRDGTLRVSADVANTGAREADEVVQLYVRDLVGSVVRPVRELKGFRRMHLKAGEKQTVEFSLPARELGFHNAEMKYVTEPGAFHVWIAPDSARGVQGAFEVTE
jgi:beta-glucosidase